VHIQTKDIENDAAFQG